MSKQKQAASLIAFIKGSTDPERGMPGCANYDHHYNTCFDDECVVMQGKRCGYFERAVLPTGDSAIRQKYEDLTGALVEGRKVNLCGDCGKAIAARQRYCEKCRRKRSRKTRREYQKAFRDKQRISA